MMEKPNKLTATSSMLIRRPAEVVFEALVNPDITTKFWFTSGSGRLNKGETVKWEWGQFGLNAEVMVLDIKQSQHISFQWPSDQEGRTYRTVEISLQAQTGDTTFVHIVESGFDEANDLLIETIAGQTEEWALVLSAMKAYLEYEINLNLIGDHKLQ